MSSSVSPSAPADAPLKRADFDFDLPPELIAQHPLPTRSASRLLVSTAGGLDDRAIADLPALLDPADLVVFNDTRVIDARLVGTKATGGRVEALVERVEGPHRARVQLRASHAPATGAAIVFGSGDGAARAVVAGRVDGFWLLDFDDPVDAVLDRHGTLPLPPYIAHAPDAADAERYQTIWARVPGAVAAPTAGLHFDRPLLDAIAARGVRTATLTLHVGAGTFVPVRVDDLAAHVMHEERYAIPPSLVEAIAEAHARGGRVVAVGTTVLRALESAALATIDERDAGRSRADEDARRGREDDIASIRAQNGAVPIRSGDGAVPIRAGDGATRLFVVPGFRFRVVDRLLTNFHLPQSTLLMLVSAFAGVERIRAAYRHAIAERYRFFSYGDAMLLERSTDALRK